MCTVILEKKGNGDRDEVPFQRTDRHFLFTVTMKAISFTSTNNKFLNSYICIAFCCDYGNEPGDMMLSQLC